MNGQPDRRTETDRRMAGRTDRDGRMDRRRRETRHTETVGQTYGDGDGRTKTARRGQTETTGRTDRRRRSDGRKETVGRLGDSHLQRGDRCRRRAAGRSCVSGEWPVEPGSGSGLFPARPPGRKGTARSQRTAPRRSVRARSSSSLCQWSSEPAASRRGRTESGWLGQTRSWPANVMISRALLWLTLDVMLFKRERSAPDAKQES